MRAAAVLALALATVTSGGCGMERDGVDWDLSESHTAADVGWEGDLSARELERGPVDRITFAGGRVWTGSEDIFLHREGDIVTDLQIRFAATTVDEAGARARDLAGEWGIDGAERIDGWERDARAAVAAHRPDDIDRLDIGAGSEPIGGPQGPVPSLQLSYSFDDDQPARVRLGFFWAPPR